MTASATRSTAPCPLLRRYVAAGHLGRKSGQGVYNTTDVRVDARALVPQGQRGGSVL